MTRTMNFSPGNKQTDKIYVFFSFGTSVQNTGHVINRAVMKVYTAADEAKAFSFKIVLKYFLKLS